MAINLQQDAHDTFKDALNSHPHNTQLSFPSKQAEFKVWMLAKNFVDNITVTGEKIHSFLKSEVCGRKGRMTTVKPLDILLQGSMELHALTSTSNRDL